MSFNCKLTKINTGTVEITLTGVIDAKSIFPMEFDFSDTQTLYIDFEKIEYINSVGIKVWVNFAGYISSFEQMEVYMRKCNRLIVAQVNRTMNFVPTNGMVSSVFVPMFCTKCDHSIEIYQDVTNLKISEQELKELAKAEEKKIESSCKHRWEADFYESDFFRFMEFKKTGS